MLAPGERSEPGDPGDKNFRARKAGDRLIAKRQRAVDAFSTVRDSTFVPRGDKSTAVAATTANVRTFKSAAQNSY